MGWRHKIKDPAAAADCPISVGEHVWIAGREGEYVVMGVDREKRRLQVLSAGVHSVLETVPIDNVRAVLTPRGNAANPAAA